MAEEKRRNLLAGAQAEFWKLVEKGLAVGAMTALSAVLGAIAIWFKDLGDLERGTLWGSAATLLVLALLLVLLGYLRRRKKMKLARAPAPLPEMVPQERVERLRELYTSWGPTVQFAYECLYADIYRVGESGSQEKRYLVWLVNNHVMRPCSEDKYRLDVQFQSLTGPTTKAAFDELLELLNHVINRRYRDTVHCILQAGEAILGKEALLASSWYSTLYQRHQEGMRELWRISARPDIGGLSSWHRSLGELLPPPTNPKQEPPTNPPPSKASEQSPPP